MSTTKFRIQKQIRWAWNGEDMAWIDQFWVEELTLIFNCLPCWSPVLAGRVVRQEGPCSTLYFKSSDAAEEYISNLVKQRQSEHDWLQSAKTNKVVTTVKEFTLN